MRNRRISQSPKTPRIDKTFFILVIILVVLGLIVIADASAPQALALFHDKFYFMRSQSIWSVLGLVVMLVASKIDYKIWNKFAYPIFGISMALLIVVLFPGVGARTLGARRWLGFGIFSFQPAEFIKLSLAMLLAKIVTERKNTLFLFVPVLVTCGLIMLEPDLGTTLIVAGMAVSVLFLSDIKIFQFIGAILLGVFSSLVVVILSPYRRDRLLTFLHKSQDPLGTDYHIRQILLALGSGGFWGIGLGQGEQKYLFLPEAATDSVFATIGEELGFIGSFLILGLFLVFVLRALKIAKNAPDRFSFLLGVGISAWIGVQTLLNIGSMVAIVPLTGVPLPFFSYGGSSLVMLFLACGILLNISRNSVVKNERK